MRRQRPVTTRSVRYASRRSARLHHRATVSLPRATSRRCVMNQPVGRRTDADATETNQPNVTVLFCGKLLACPACEHRQRDSTKENPHKYGAFRTRRSQAAQQHGDVAQGPAATSLSKVKKVLMR